ncbi:MAG: hypothetical protein WED34_15790 [Planctomycetales bacterium]
MSGAASILRLCCVLVLAPLGTTFAAGPPARPAQVEVPDWGPVKLAEGGVEGWRKVPQYLVGANVYCRPADDAPDEKQFRQSFTVKQPGLLLVAATWPEPRNESGEWDPAHLRPSQLIGNGWVAIDTMQQRVGPRTLAYTIFRRVAKAGERFDFQTSDVWPPLAIIVNPQQAAVVQARPEIVAPSNPVAAFDPPTPAPRGTPANVRNVLLLDVHDPPEIDSKRLWNDMLVRELVRQSILLAAREELGLFTRDAMLREEFPQEANPAQVPLDVMVSNPWRGGRLSITIHRQVGDKYVPVWDKELGNPQARSVAYQLSWIEDLSQKELPRLLRSLGYQGEPPAFRGHGPVPAEIAKKLDHLGMLSQFAAVRELHALARTEGSSPEILAALARGYANLGVLTEHFWSPAHQVFKARGLLYAERLLARGGKQPSPESLLVRGYVRTLVGMHALGGQDLAEGRAKFADLADAGPIPDWAEVAWAYARYDRQRLQSAENEGTQQGLARLLRVVSLEGTANEQQTAALESASRMLETVPDCDRAMGLMYEIGSLGIKRAAAVQGNRYFAESLYPGLKVIRDLPEEVRQLAEAGGAADGEPERRAALIDALKKAGRPQTDRGEPSLDCLGQLVCENSFIHAMFLIDFLHTWLGVDTRDAIDRMLPLLEKHPYGFYPQSFITDPKRKQELLRRQLQELLSPRAIAALENSERPMLFAAAASEPASGHWNVLSNIAWKHGNRDTYRGILKELEFTTGEFRAFKARQLRAASPDMPAAVAVFIAEDWEGAQRSLPGFEARYHDEPLVMLRLGEQYLKRDRPADGERFLKRYVELQPNWSGYSRLASLRWQQKDYDGWRQTLEESLEAPVAGLEHATARVMLARYFLTRNEPEKALPYAEAAAATYSGWSLECAAECHEEVGNWEKAEQYVRAAAERYDGSALDWLLWCRRTNRGNERAARDHARKLLESRGELPPDQLGNTYVFYLLTDERENALKVLERTVAATNSDYTGMMLAVVADGLKRTDVRDAALRRVAEMKDLQGGCFVSLAKLFRDHLAAGDKARLDRDAVSAIVASARTNQVVPLWFLVGEFLANRGDDEANHYLQLAACSPQWVRPHVVLSRMALRRRGVEIDQRRRVLVPGQEPNLAEPTSSVP